MTKKSKTTILILALVIYAIIIAVCLMNGLTGPALILGAFFVILAICLGIYIREEPDEFSVFLKNKRRILKTYNSIIVEVEDIPNIAGKNIIKVKSIEDLVDAQLELREPIYYKNDNDSCFFMLLHYNEACIYILRMNADVVSPTEQSIKYMKEEPTTKKENENILDNIENTIVYKLDELRSFKISPIRNNTEVKIIDDTAIKAELENKKDNVTKEKIEDELSKTMYLKNLKEQMAEYEEQQEAVILEEQRRAKEEEKENKKEEQIEEEIPTDQQTVKLIEPEIGKKIDLEETIFTEKPEEPIGDFDKIIEEIEQEVKIVKPTTKKEEVPKEKKVEKQAKEQEETKKTTTTKKTTKTTKKTSPKSTHAARRASNYKKK